MATITSSHIAHSQSATEIAKEKLYATTPHGMITWKLTWEVPKHHRQMLPKRTPPTQDLQQAHTEAQLLLHAQHEEYHLVTQQSTTIRLPPVANTNKHLRMQLQKKKDQCPLDGKCLTQNVVYQATFTTQTSSDSYKGLARNFKECYRNHTASFQHQNKTNETELFKHIWTLKDNNKCFTIKWRIKLCRPYSNISHKCNLCLFEKFVIICKTSLCTLTKRNKLASGCPPQKQIPTQELCDQVMQCLSNTWFQILSPIATAFYCQFFNAI